MDRESRAVAELEHMGRKLSMKRNTRSKYRPRRLSYAEIMDREPRLKHAEALAREYAGSPDYRLWDQRVKPAFKYLVGMMSKHPDERLHTSEAYDLVYKRLLSIYED